MRDKKIYRASDAIHSITIPGPERFAEGLRRLQTMLAQGDHEKTQALTAWLVRSLCNVLRVSQVHVRVLAKRPSNTWGELHGLYERTRDGRTMRITVWMRTAKRKDVVAFKTFLRTVVHELAHHLDYTYLHLADSLHTEGFYKREASMSRQLLQHV